MPSSAPVDTIHLFPVLDKLLIELLQSLSPEEWELPTIARLWKVRDIAAHLLDGNLRAISIYRDHYFGEKPEQINAYSDLVSFLNELNGSWVKAAKRISPGLITDLLMATGREYHEQLQQLDPFAPAVFPVAWAGEEMSLNWFHIAREYTEKYIHQMQIREAVGRQEAMLTKELFHPFIDTFMYGLPHTYREVPAADHTIIRIVVETPVGGTWHLEKKADKWVLAKEPSGKPAGTVSISPGIAWKLFSRGMTPQEARDLVTITGNAALGEKVLNLIAVMA